MYPEKERKSLLFQLKPIIQRLPAVKRPEGHVHFKTKLFWTIIILIFYFLLTNVMIYGLEPGETLDMFAAFRAIMAGEAYSILHLGIGPIVTASIIMQLFVGAKIIKLDLTKDEDKAIYQGTQKLLVIAMIFIQAVPQVFGLLEPSTGLKSQLGLWGARSVIIAQLAIGSYLVFLMDEVVSKWGIGSGISLFIAAGVSQAIFTGTFNWALENPNLPASATGPARNLPVGTIPKTIYIVQSMSSQRLSMEGFETIMLGQPNPMIALIGTTIVFFIVAYVESTRIELPLAHGRVRGARGRYPLRLIYASNIPVILMSALLANVQMFSLLLWQHPPFNKIPLIGGQYWVGAYLPGRAEPVGGIAFYLSGIRGVYEWLLPLIDYDRWAHMIFFKSPVQIVARVVIYVSVMVIGSIFFAKFWIETTNMGSEAVAKQIIESGLQIPGFRRDPRVMKLVLDRYIPAITIISGAFVGALAAGADMIGTVGRTTGTGLLLCVGIIIQLYELIGREQLMEMHPVLRGFFGEE
jgi:preprotein translocase subunit SecY